MNSDNGSKTSPSKLHYPRTMAASESLQCHGSGTVSASDCRINVGVLGATGTVGQRFIVLLAAHPWFRIHMLGASSRSAGKPFLRAVTWKQSTPIPSIVKELVVQECKPENFVDCRIIFSGLDAEAAGDIGTPN